MKVNKRNTTHGMFGTRLYGIWSGMVHVRSHKDFIGRKYYKHVKVCESWKKFENFQAWAMANGYRDDLTIDRKDNLKGYSPANCRWATSKEQARNRRSNVYISFGGKRLLAVEWAEKLGLHRSTVTRRIKSGWSVKDACTKPGHRGLEPHERQ